MSSFGKHTFTNPFLPGVHKLLNIRTSLEYCKSGAPVPRVVFYHGDMYEENFNVLSTQNCTNPVSIILGKAVVLQFGDLRMNILIF